MPYRPFRAWFWRSPAAYYEFGGGGAAPQIGGGAEEIRVMVAGPLVLSMTVDELEALAQTEEATGDFALVARFLDEPTLTQLRQGLTRFGSRRRQRRSPPHLLGISMHIEWKC